MSGFFIGRFKGSYESGAAGSYLVLKENFNEKVYNYQVEMLANNIIDGILPMDVRYKNNELALYYNITSKQPLGELLKKRKFTGNEFVRIISSIARAMLEARNYLLQDKLFLLDENYMYINPNTLDVSMVYIPIQFEGNHEISFKEFVVRLIMFLINVDESANDILQRVLINVKKETFNISDFYKILMEAGDRGTVTDIKPQEFKEEQKGKDMPVSPKQFSNPLSIQKKQEIKGKERDIKIPQVLNSDNREKDKPVLQKQKNSNNNIQYNSTTIIAGLVLQVSIIIVLTAVFKSGVLDSLSEDKVTTYGAFSLVIGAVDFLIIRKLLQSKSIREADKKGKDSEALQKDWNISSRDIRSINAKDISKIQQNQKEERKDAVEKFRDATTLLSMDDAGLKREGAQGIKRPYIVLDETDEKIYINKESFIIGRLKERVDFFMNNNAIGKMHAEFVLRNEECYLKDLNSRNGTFVNDVRLDSNIEYQVSDKDRIVLANSQFIFHI